MEKLSEQQYQQLVQTGEILSEDGYGEKVVMLSDGQFVKIFRLKRPWSSGLIKPYVVRFAENAARLERLDIPTLHVDKVVYCASRKRHLGYYRPLAGDTLRDRLADANDEERARLLIALAGFLAHLHQLGVYFRSAHFGNLVVHNENLEFGLIDVADMRFRRRPLGPLMRARNFRHMCRYEQDRNDLRAYGLTNFLDHYLACSRLTGRARTVFLQQLRKSLPWFTAEIAAIEDFEREADE
jgi:hypothetical protein